MYFNQKSTVESKR